MTSIHAVLGARGAVGRETVRALQRRALPVVSVGRHDAPGSAATGVRADLLDPSQALRALEGVDVAYFVVGLPYSHRVWAAEWPVMLRNVISAALAHSAKLVYLDNVYAYGAVDGPMTEATPIRPSSRKGEVRAAALATLGEAVEQGLSVTIGRSADFYGPGVATSVFNTFALDRIAAGRTGRWLYDADLAHSLTYTPDIGEALAVLGTDARAEGRTWHLPTAPALTGREYIRVAAGEGAKVAVMSDATMRLGSMFSRPARETHELRYQYRKPYVFDSSAYEQTFGVTATPVREGIRSSLDAAARGATQRPGSHPLRPSGAGAGESAPIPSPGDSRD